MDKKSRIREIEGMIREQHKMNEINGASLMSYEQLATAIEEAIGIDRQVLFDEMLTHLGRLDSKTASLAKDLSSNPNIITIKPTVTKGE